MKKNCGSCNYRVPGTDSHMVCKLRDYVLRVSKTDKCTSWKGDYYPVEIPQEYLKEFAQLLMVGSQEFCILEQKYGLTTKEKQALKFAEKLVKYYA